VAAPYLLTLPPTRLEGISRTAALLLMLVALVAIVTLLVAAAHQVPVPKATTTGRSDLVMYGHIVDAMRAGKGYYPAAHAELLKGSYGTRSVFNWRLPALPWLVSLVPFTSIANALLDVAAAAGLALTFRTLEVSEGRATATLAVAFAVISIVFVAAPNAVLFADITAGALIFLSAAAYGSRLPWLGFAAALLALFCRELTAPYVVVCAFLAWHERRRWEIAAWIVGLVAFAAYFAWHYAEVQAQLGPADGAYPSGWLQFGGLTFVLSTAAFNGLLALAPHWPSAIVLPLAVVGLIAWPGIEGRRVAATVAAYLVLFLFVGKPFNDYWGALYTPLLMLGLAFAPAAFRDLIAAFRAPRLATAA